MNNLLVKFCICFVRLFAAVSVYAQTDTIRLNADNDALYIIKNQYSQYLKDATKSLSFDDIYSGKLDTLFKNPTHYTILEPNTKVWIKYTFKNQSDKFGQWILGAPTFVLINFYIVDESGNVELVKSGTKLPASQKQIKNGMYELAAFHLNAGETKTIYIEAMAEVAVKIQQIFDIHGFQEYYTRQSTFYLVQGLFNGTLLILFIYNLFLFFMLRKRVYLFYNMYIINIQIYGVILKSRG